MRSIPINTDRLVLRYIEIDDAPDMFEYASVPEVSEYLLWSPHINLSATEGYIEFLQKRYLRGLYADWAVVLKETNKMIGTCGFASINTSAESCEIGYVLSPDYRAKGYMTEAVNAVLKLTFEVLGIQNATLRIIAENADSIKLAKRVGFKTDNPSKTEMEIKGVVREILHYTMSKSEYEAKKEAV